MERACFESRQLVKGLSMLAAVSQRVNLFCSLHLGYQLLEARALHSAFPFREEAPLSFSGSELSLLGI